MIKSTQLSQLSHNKCLVAFTWHHCRIQIFLDYVRLMLFTMLSSYYLYLCKIILVNYVISTKLTKEAVHLAWCIVHNHIRHLPSLWLRRLARRQSKRLSIERFLPCSSSRWPLTRRHALATRRPLVHQPVQLEIITSLEIEKYAVVTVETSTVHYHYSTQ